VLVAGGTEFVEWVIVLSSTVPVVGLIWFAWWFLRAGRRYDERERAASSGSPPGRPPDSDGAR
jgi:hypothetical protein